MGRSKRWLDAVTLQLLKVLDGREGIIKVMEQTLPILIPGGAPKPDRVVFQRPPPYEQQVLSLNLNAASEFMRPVAR